MWRAIPEPDWKVFRQLREAALERFCARVLAEVAAIAAESGRSSHERYLAVFRLIEERNQELAMAFDGPRRSRALGQLARMAAGGLLTGEELSRFSRETRETVELLAGL